MLGVKDKERVLVRDKFKNEVKIIRYVWMDKTHFDLETDGRVYLTPKLAKRLSSELLKWATKKEGSDAGK